MKKLIKKRWPVLAAILNLVSNGLGFLYVGNPAFAIAFWIGSMLFFAVCGWTGLIFTAAGIYVMVLVAVLVAIAAIVLAAVMAKRAGEMSLRWYQRWYVYVGYAALV